ncbi:DUF2273 domain-containing protein [Collinsella tanakaei]|uniref:DUF2273 domain-containing protein n=1 Tax=Collinsella tanakaei TaxID=626935 RepID=UPI0025A4C9F6|nr:DUF2273 domain-containing protein [Collinsella tanakaei]MDM8300769.1 DUF2273 domain-containing protein [Collinsella tanakaei]
MSNNASSDRRKASAAPKLSIDQAPVDAEDFEHPEEPKRARRSIDEDAIGFIKGLGASVWAYADSHHYTVLYGFIGFILAILILTLGLWATIVIAVFAGVGATLGQIRDGDNGIVNFFRRLFSGKR